MSTALEHRHRQRDRRLRFVRAARRGLHEGWLIVRPVVLPAVAYVGAYLAIDELRSSPIHHNMIIWVLGLLFSGQAVYGMFKEVRNRLVLRKFLATTDGLELNRQLPSAKKAAAALPFWHRRRLLAKKQEVDVKPLPARDAPLGREPSVGISLQARLRRSPLFILAFLLALLVGPISFLDWFQSTLSGSGPAWVALFLWGVCALFFLATGAAIGADMLGRRLHAR